MLGSQRLQYPLIQACSLNHMRDPTILHLWNAGLKEWPGFSTGSQNKGPELSASPRMREGLGYRCLWSEEDFLAVVGGSWCRKRARCGRQAFTSAKQDTGTALSKASAVVCSRQFRIADGDIRTHTHRGFLKQPRPAWLEIKSQPAWRKTT